MTNEKKNNLVHVHRTIVLKINGNKRTNVYFVQHYLICWNNPFPYLHFVIDPSHKLLSVSAFFPTHWYFFLKIIWPSLTCTKIYAALLWIVIHTNLKLVINRTSHDTICQFIFIQFIVWLHISPHHKNRNTHSK